ncbi:MAG: hypothetical protein IK137_03875 [Bacilli bacterium]|nr:hypothetical protein [Bacilli bacterium]
MKVRNYEKQVIIIFILIILITIEILSFIVLYNYKVYKYKKLTGIISNNNIVTLIIDKNDKELLYKNKKIYLNNKLLEYKILENKGYITKKDNTKYYEILINVKTPKNKKSSDYVELSIKNKKINILKLLKKIGEGDN